MEARLAQSVEHETLNLRVVGSSPTLGANFFPFLFGFDFWQCDRSTLHSCHFFEGFTCGNRDVLQNENCNFRISLGTRCEKNGACSRISTRKFVWTAFFANKFFVSRSNFREVNPVVQLVQSSGSVAWFTPFKWICKQFFFRIEMWTSVMFSWSTFAGLWWAACRMVFWTFKGSKNHPATANLLLQQYIAVDSFRSGNGLHFAFCGQEEQRTNSPSSMSPSSWAKIFHHNPTTNHPKQLITNSANYEATEVDRLVKTSHTICSQSPWHKQSANRNFNFRFAKRCDGSPDRHDFRVASNPVSRKFPYEFCFAKPP